MGDKRAIGSLIPHLEDEDYFVRNKALESLCKLDDQKARSILNKEITLRKKPFLARQEIRVYLYIITIAGVLTSFLAVVSSEGFVNSTIDMLSLQEGLSYGEKVVIAFIFFLGLLYITFLVVLVIFSIMNRPHIEVLFERKFDIWIGPFIKVLKEKIGGEYPIEKNTTGVIFNVKGKGDKDIKIGIWNSNHYFDNDYSLYIENFNLINTTDQDKIMNCIKEAIFEYLLTPEKS